jgi:hypothetical protein
MSDKSKKPIYYTPDLNDDEQHARLEAASLAIGEFWSEQYQAAEWIGLARIADWIVARDQNSNRVARDEMLIDDPARAVYLKLSKAIAAGFFNPIILVSSQWLVDGSEDIPARSTITIDQFKQAARSYITERWIGPEVETDMFIAAYLQEMAVTSRGCADWLSREGYGLPPWLKAIANDKVTTERAAAVHDEGATEEAAPPKRPRGRRPGDGSFASYFDELVSAHDLEGCRDVFWNLGQVIAWVETRSLFPVDALSDSTKDLARRDHSMPAGLPHFAAELADRSADENGLARIKSPFQSVDGVRRAVLRRFQSGLLTASGQRRGSFDREPITPLEWADLTMDDNLAGEMTVRHRDGFVEAWSDVRVKGDDVISAFPMPAAQPEDVRIAAPRKGRAPIYDWDDAMEFAKKELGERGDFNQPENAVDGWRSQADLMRLVIGYVAKLNDGNEPPESTVKFHLRTTIAQWRASRK